MNFALDVIVKPTLILMSVAALSMLLHRRSAAVRHAVWVLAMVSVILLPLAVLIVPQLEWSVLPQTGTSVTFLSIQNASSQSAQEIWPAATHSAKTARLHPEFIWGLVITFLLLRLVLATTAVKRMTKTAVVIADDNWRKHLTGLSDAFLIRRPVRLLFSDKQICPMTWGVRNHTILLPSSARQWSDERCRLVLAHELAHVKRNDGLLQVFIQIVCSVYWFNPLVWYAAHRIRIERERACDDRVLSLGAEAVDYADHLVQVVRTLRTRRALSFASVSMAQPSQLESRLISILDSGMRRRTLSKTGTILLCTFAGLLTITVAAIGIAAAVPLPPVFVSAVKFTPPAATPESTAQRTRIGNGNAIPNSALIPPQVLEPSKPDYTQEGVEANIEGTVTLEGHVDIKGEVSRLRVIKGLGYGLDQKAIDAVLGWKFRPALRNGAPVEAITQIEVDFRIPAWYRAVSTEEPAVRIAPGITPPTVISRVEPQYTPEARAAKYRGTVVVAATIHKDGTLTVNEVIQELDYGLTPNAIEALEQWKFKPGMRNGEPVPVSLKIEVNFNLK
ncbi:MAG TPA: M56 family metallopeptidase [Terriglobia bacterium]|nr:M56 family metallopeptidase [Terriglobia bacterium]